MRASLVDLLPDQLSPLYSSLGIPALISGAHHVGKIMTSSTPSLHNDYYTTLNNYAYMNAAMPARTWWWVLT